MGPYTEFRMAPVDILQWSPVDQMVGIHDTFAEVATVEEIRAVSQKGGANPSKATTMMSEQTVWS